MSITEFAPAPRHLDTPWPTVRLRPVASEVAATGARRRPAVVGEGLTVTTVLGATVTYANCDHAASTPALVAVKQAVDAALQTYSSVHRGNGYASQVTSAHYEAARAEVGRFVGARDGDHVVFTRNTTDSLNLLARALPRRTTVFVFASEHHATLLPWSARRTVRLPVPASIRDAQALLDEALAAAPAGGPRLVVLTGASNVTGELWDLPGLVAVARAHGARVALDGAQLVAHRTVDLAALDVDYLAFSGHKLYAPFGAGVLVGRGDWLDAAPPYLAGGGATVAVTDRAVTWATGPARHEAGSPNVIGAIAVAAACATLRRHRVAIERHEVDLAARLAEGLAGIAGVRTWALFGAEADRVGVAAFTVDGLDSALVSTVLAAEHGIGVRDGKFCAHLLVDDLLADADADGVGAAAGGSRGQGVAPTTAVRVSLGLANTVEHVERLVAAVARLAAYGPQLDWTHDGTAWTHSGAAELTVPALW